MRDTVDKILTPVMLPTSVPLAPDYILRMIKCSCENCVISPKLVRIISALMYRLLHVRWRNECLNTNNYRGLVLLLSKCHIQIMIRKMTNKGITMLCQHIYNSCTIAISANQQC